MSDYNHKMTMDTIVQAFQLANVCLEAVQDDDLKSAKRTISHVHAMAPILDPTAYMKALDDDRLNQSDEVINWAKDTKLLFKALANGGD